mmetsp:Transcript_97016/g.175298  ORF Transcript_97016/g.175298 Transcript_97016/m.175298 type:complete len:187 (-) Transcript_97016:173-733(-)
MAVLGWFCEVVSRLSLKALINVWPKNRRCARPCQMALRSFHFVAPAGRAAVSAVLLSATHRWSLQKQMATPLRCEDVSSAISCSSSIPFLSAVASAPSAVHDVQEDVLHEAKAEVETLVGSRKWELDRKARNAGAASIDRRKAVQHGQVPVGGIPLWWCVRTWLNHKSQPGPHPCECRARQTTQRI